MSRVTRTITTKAMSRTHRISVNLTAEEQARFQELRPPGTSSASFLRRLLRDAKPITPPTHEEALGLLGELARAGSVQATVALERALRPSARGQGEVDDAIDRILREESE